MIEFKKYSSIENYFYKDYLDQVREQVPADMQWVVQEQECICLCVKRLSYEFIHMFSFKEERS